MHLLTLFTCVSFLSTTGWAQYSLQDDYFQGGSFLSRFAFFTGGDPTNGFVEYLSQAEAQTGGLVSGSSPVRIGVNDKDVTSTGRQSVRLTSRQAYDSGLVVLDLGHMPGGICGTWPAFWMVGPSWPTHGEIDIIEGVNDQASNQMTLHTGNTCDIGGSSMIGTVLSPTCDVSNGDNSGCGISTHDTQNYGRGFNAAGGGVYATEWTSAAINIWFWPKGREPADVLGDSPNPSGWGMPQGAFSGGCNIDSSFSQQNIVFDTTFCGDWAGVVWGGSSCAASTGAATCNEYVGQNPQAFTDAYWSINALKVYQSNGQAPPPGSPSGAPYSGSPSGAPSGGPRRPAQSGAASGAPAPSGAPSGGPRGPAPSGPAGPAPSGFATSPIHDGPTGGGPTGGGRDDPRQTGAPAPGGDPHHHFQGGPPADFEAQTMGFDHNWPRETPAAKLNDSHSRHFRLHRDRHGRL